MYVGETEVFVFFGGDEALPCILITWEMETKLVLQFHSAAMQIVVRSLELSREGGGGGVLAVFLKKVLTCRTLGPTPRDLLSDMCMLL